MNHAASWRALSRLAGWGFLSLAGLLFAPTAARASCGDYLTIRTPDGKTVTPPHQGPTDPLNPDAPAPPAPCDGPHCSQAPASPPAPAPAPVTPQTFSEWGCLADGLLAAALEAAFLRDDQNPQHPLPLPDGVFHPPRRAS
jgi:hypothetical protein